VSRHALPSWEWPVAGVAHVFAFALVALGQCGSKPEALFRPPDAIIVEMVGPPAADSRMPQRAERAPTPRTGAEAPDDAVPPPNPSKLALPDAAITKGAPESAREDLMAELRKQQLLAALDAPEGKTDRLETGATSTGSGSTAQAGVKDPELARWVVRANEELKKNFHPLPAWCAANSGLVARAAAAVSADGRITEALVLGDEPLMGVLPLEAMDLMVDPLRQQLVANPAHPNYPVALAK